MKKVRYYIFLKDVLLLTLSAFGGPQAHLTLFFNVLVKKRGYLTAEELIDLNSFCQILPGPASTQTLIAVGYKIGGTRLAFLTLLVWVFPAFVVMTAAGIFISQLQDKSLEFARFIQPMGVAFVIYAAYKISSIVINSKTSYFIFIISAVVCYFITSPIIFPIILILAGFITSFRFKKQPIEQKKESWSIDWSKLILYGAIFAGAALLGSITRGLPDNLPISKPIRLFENFFRNGSLIFGGGQALIALLYKEFVEFKGYLLREEFLSGYALLHSLPGPLFSISGYIGTISMKEYGLGGMIIGSVMATAGIFLPGTLFIFFIVNLWARLKNHRVVRASMEGINAGSAGIVTATAILLFKPLIEPIEIAYINYLIVTGTVLLLLYTKVPPPFIILGGLIAGIII